MPVQPQVSTPISRRPRAGLLLLVLLVLLVLVLVLLALLLALLLVLLVLLVLVLMLLVLLLLLMPTDLLHFTFVQARSKRDARYRCVRAGEGNRACPASATPHAGTRILDTRAL
jgi:hypothetical protein